jgi:hypothetical protein
MKQRRLCETKDAMLGTLVQLVRESGHAEHVGHKISLLKCPFEQHCDKTSTAPCRGFTSRNRQLVSEIESEFFVRGYTKGE